MSVADFEVVERPGAGLRGADGRRGRRAAATSCSPAARRRAPPTRSSSTRSRRSGSTLDADDVLVRRRALRRARRRALQLRMIQECAARTRWRAGLRSQVERMQGRARARGRRRGLRARSCGRPARPSSISCCSGIGPDGHTASLFPDQPSLFGPRPARRRRAARPGLEPFVPRVSLTLPALTARAPGRRAGRGQRQGRRDRRRVRPGRRARIRTCPRRCSRRRPSELTVLLDPDAAARLDGARADVSREVIGVDLGGTKVAVARLSGRRLSTRRSSRPSVGLRRAASSRWPRWSQSMRGDELDGVGIGVPSVVEFATGRVDLLGQHPARRRAAARRARRAARRAGVRRQRRHRRGAGRGPRRASCGWSPATW